MIYSVGKRNNLSKKRPFYSYLYSPKCLFWKTFETLEALREDVTCCVRPITDIMLKYANMNIKPGFRQSSGFRNIQCETSSYEYPGIIFDEIVKLY